MTDYHYDFSKGRKCGTCDKPIKNNNTSGLCIKHAAATRSLKSPYECYTCKKEVLRRPDELGQRVFCSRRCHGLWQSARPKELHPNWGRGMSQEEIDRHVTARNILNKAVKRGEVLKTPCINCGNLKSEGHHEDYSKPLEVIWLCRAHHRQQHREAAEAYKAKLLSDNAQ